jgi:putative component of toxin-antitoxin plasmid stabilization module
MLGAGGLERGSTGDMKSSRGLVRATLRALDLGVGGRMIFVKDTLAVLSILSAKSLESMCIIKRSLEWSVT